MRALFASLLLLPLLSACKPAPEPGTFEPVNGSCAYINGFSDNLECKEYLGRGWTLQAVEADCEQPIVNAGEGTFTRDLPCETETHIGICWLDSESQTPSRIVFPEGDQDACAGAQLGCDFAQGEFEPAGVCAGLD
jgi:hypothetical protein